jgi:hypothetical protein
LTGIFFQNLQNCLNFAPAQNGFVAEWLGRALQKLLQQFESARNLERKPNRRKAVFSLRRRNASGLPYLQF